MTSKYQTIKLNETTKDIFDNYYPDIFTFEINNFKSIEAPFKHKISEVEINRFDILVYNYYGTSDYTDLILWLNNIDNIRTLEAGTELEFPTQNDISRFYSSNLV